MKMSFKISFIAFNGVEHIVDNGLQYTYGEAMKEAESLRLLYDTQENPIVSVLVEVNY